MKKEIYFSASVIEHTPSDGSPGTLTGYVTKYGQLSDDRGGYFEMFSPTAFSNLKEENYSVKALRDHSDIYLGRTDNGTLTLSQDEIGLKFSLQLPDTQDGRDTAALVARKDLSGMSFGYVPKKAELKKDENGQRIRLHTSGTLVEVSVVYDPAFKNTSVELHSLTEPNPQVLEEFKKLEGTPNRNYAERELQLARFQKI